MHIVLSKFRSHLQYKPTHNFLKFPYRISINKITVHTYFNKVSESLNVFKLNTGEMK